MSKLGQDWYWKSVTDGLQDVLHFVEVMKRRNWDYVNAPTSKGAKAPNVFKQTTRSPDGRYNNPTYHEMGSANTPFARNVSQRKMQGKSRKGTTDILQPNPRVVSNKLMARGRGGFKPVPGLNLLAAAWIQFQVHDWFGHENDEENLIKVPVDEPDDLWPGIYRPMMVNKTKKADEIEEGQRDTYLNTQVHWWDGSQIYGSSQERLLQLRKDDQNKLVEDGKLFVEDDGSLPYDDVNDADLTGFNDNWWLGLRILHNLFVLEHNKICDKLRECHEDWSGDKIFNVARLINCALMAKIHTIEWTPALLNHPTVILGMKADWCGLTEGDFNSMADAIKDYLTALAKKEMGLSKQDPDFTSVKKYFEDFGIDSWTGKSMEELQGILDTKELGIRAFMRLLIEGEPKRIYETKTDYLGNRHYAMTEEFVAVYRMHPLIPDAISLRHLNDNMKIDPAIDSYGFRDMAFGKSRTITDEMVSLADAIYSFGTENCGALTLNNFPEFLRMLDVRPNDLPVIDLAAVDILRDRERDLPRYNDFREFIYNSKKARVDDYMELTGNDEGYASKLEEVYGSGKVDDVDLMVGLLAEPKPPGFGFGETTFRVFALMTPMRLKSDRWFTKYYSKEHYTPEGMEWIEKNNMRSVLARNYPELTGILRHIKNPFKTWPIVKPQD